MKTLVIGGSGFVGSYLLEEIEADNLDLRLGEDARHCFGGKYDTVIFLACNQANTQEAYNENWEMFKALDDYRRRYPKTHLIYISSAAVYYPGTTYGQTKRLGEIYARRFDKCTILRPSNIYGHGDGHGAPDKFLRGEREIYGDGSYVRDLISVEEVVDTIIYFLKNREYGIFNVSTGKGTTVNQMFKMFGSGKPQYIKHKLGRDMDIPESILKPGRVDD